MFLEGIPTSVSLHTKSFVCLHEYAFLFKVLLDLANIWCQFMEENTQHHRITNTL